MYPESNATKQDHITKAKIALIDYMVGNIDSVHSWHVSKPTHVGTLLSQQMNMIQAARRIFDEQGVPREHHQEFLQQPIIISYDCIKAFVNKLWTRNTTWDHNLYALIQAEMDAIKPAYLSLMDLQRIVTKTILEYDTLKNSVETAAPAQLTTADFGKSTSKSSQI